MVLISAINSTPIDNHVIDRVYSAELYNCTFKDILKTRWHHSIQMYRDYKLPTLSNVQVFSLYNDNTDITNVLHGLDTSYNVFYQIGTDQHDYCCNWRIFSSLNNYWLTIEHGNKFRDIFKHDYMPGDCYREWLYANNIKVISINV